MLISNAVVLRNILCKQLIKVAVAADNNVFASGMILYPPCDKVISFAVTMLQHCAVRAGSKELFKFIKRFPITFIFFCILWVKCCTGHCTIGFVWLIEVFTPATSFKTNHNMFAAKVTPCFVNAREHNMVCHTNFSLNVITTHHVPCTEKHVCSVN